MSGGSAGWAGKPIYDVDSETYEQDYPKDQYDYSTKGLWADVVGTFAGVFLILSGIFEVLNGAAAIADPDFYAEGHPYLYRLNMTAWGSIHLAIGVLSFVAAIGILRRASWGQISGVIIAGLSAIANFAFIPHYPLWSFVVIGVDVLVIWALLTQLGHRAT
jgi:hypothetical protein